jgi:dihydrolipoamide dehydrogenase
VWLRGDADRDHRRGPAGYEAALVAAGRGRDVTEVTVVDSDGIGGACVLFDCVPSKTFIASTGVRTELRRASGLGFDIGIEDAKISLPQINNRVKTLARSQSADIGSQLLRERSTWWRAAVS